MIKERPVALSLSDAGESIKPIHERFLSRVVAVAGSGRNGRLRTK
jgi:hypothetical protein